ncbi:MAG: LysO family transporter [Cellulosilyticaceae bacterium]
MGVLLMMCVGILIGMKCFPEKWGKYNNYIQLCSIIILIFCMGISLGANPDFVNQFIKVGVKGAIFAIVPIVFSVGGVYLLTQKFMNPKEGEKDN